MACVEQSENGRYVVHGFKDEANKTESELVTADVRNRLFELAVNLIKRIEGRYDPAVIP